MWRLYLGEARVFVSRVVTFDETQISMMCRDMEKGKEKVHVKVESFTNG